MYIYEYLHIHLQYLLICCVHNKRTYAYFYMHTYFVVDHCLSEEFAACSASLDS